LFQIKKFPVILLEDKSCFKLRHFTSHSLVEKQIFALYFAFIKPTLNALSFIHRLGTVSKHAERATNAPVITANIGVLISP
jgi:hypothetical protein